MPDSDQKSASALPRILLIEDDAMVRVLCRRVLAAAGFEVLEARDGAEGIRLFEAEHPALQAVLLDVTLPDLSGAEILRRLLAIRADLPILLSTGKAKEEVEKLIASSPFVSYLQKPFLPADLVERVCASVQSVPPASKMN